MRQLHRLVFLAALTFAAGCASSHNIVGTWKGDIVPAEATKSSTSGDADKDKLAKALEAGISGFLKDFVGPLTLEFNSDGRYKASVKWGSSTGSYKLTGDVVTLTPDAKDSKSMHVDLNKLTISADGKTLRTAKEFKSGSDTQLVLTRQ